MTFSQTSLLLVLGSALAVGCGGKSTGSSTGSGSTSGGSTSGSSGTTGTTASDDTVIATGLTDPSDLLIDGTAAYWTTTPQQPSTGDAVPGSIDTVPLTGGTPSVRVPSTLFPGALASDGTHLFWFAQDASGVAQIMTSAIDGSNPTVLAALGDATTRVAEDTRLFAVDGTLYWGDDGQGVMSLPPGGVPTPLVAPSVILGGPLIAADDTGLVWTESDGSHTLLRHAALDGSGAATLATFASGLDGVIYPAAIGVDGTKLVWFQVDRSGQDDVSSLYEVPLSGGTPSKILDYDGEVDAMAVDSGGIYFHDDVASTEAVYKVTGSTTAIFHSAPNALSTSANDQRFLRLDAANLYWVSGGSNGGQAALHKKAR